MSRRLLHRTRLRLVVECEDVREARRRGMTRRLVIDSGETLMFGTGAAVMFRLLRLASGYRWVFAVAAIVQCLLAVRMAAEVVRDARRLRRKFRGIGREIEE